MDELECFSSKANLHVLGLEIVFFFVFLFFVSLIDCDDSFIGVGRNAWHPVKTKELVEDEGAHDQEQETINYM